MSDLQPIFEEVDVEKITTAAALKHYLNANDVYLLMYDGRFTLGKFSEDRSRFRPLAMASYSLQVGYPFRDNSLSGASFQRLWRFVNYKEIRAADEMRYAESNRASTIRRKLQYFGVTIDETSPIEAYLYEPTADPMPSYWVEGLYEDEDDNWIDDWEDNNWIDDEE